MVREEVLNTELAGYLARGVTRALRIPEASVRVINTKTSGPRGRRRAPDIQLVDFFGVRIIVQGKIDDLDSAIADCKQSIIEGLADACIAVSYPRDLAAELDIKDIRAALEEADLDIALVKPPVQLTLDGWPEDAIRRWGKLKPAGIVGLLNGDALYDEVVGSDLAERLATNIGDILAGAEALPAVIQRRIASRLAEALAIRFEGDTEESAEEE